MESISIGNFAAFLAKAEVGTSFSAQIYSIIGGNIRVTCNWLYSALNIAPSNTSDFVWNIRKIDNSHVSLSPHNSCISKPIYTSIRDDNNQYVQVQAAHSGDWVETVQRNETIEIEIGDLMLTTFRGFNGMFLRREPSLTSYDGHSGYRLKSLGSSQEDSTTWFLSINKIDSENHEWVGGSIELEQLKSTLENKNIKLEKEELTALHKVMNSYANTY